MLYELSLISARLNLRTATGTILTDQLISGCWSETFGFLAQSCHHLMAFWHTSSVDIRVARSSRLDLRSAQTHATRQVQSPSPGLITTIDFGDRGEKQSAILTRVEWALDETEAFAAAAAAVAVAAAALY